MKLKAVSGQVFYVQDALKTADFYEKIGFIVTKRDAAQASVRLNWFWMDFHTASTEDKPEFKADASAEQKGAGSYTYVSVDNVDEVYRHILDQGLEPSSEPRDWPWGNREFALRDPDGYKLVFFQKN